MGFLDFLGKVAETTLPYAVDLVENKITSAITNSNHSSTNKNELIGECDDFLSIVLKLDIDDENEIINCFSAIDKRILKLEELDLKCDADCLTQALYRIQNEREKAMDVINQKYDDCLNKLNNKSETENNLDSLSENNNKLFQYQEKQQKLMEYNLESIKHSAEAFEKLI